MNIHTRNTWAVLLLFILVLLVAPEISAANPPGTIKLTVDASEAPRRIFHARLEIPVTPGPVTLFYPEWIPGEHSPTGPIADVMDLKFTAGGKTLAWRRDLVNMYAFHLEAPAGATSLEVRFDFISAAPAQGFSSGASATAQLAVISWNQVLLYPQGWPAHDLTYQANLRIPAGWKFATALPVERASGENIEFKPAPLETLVDSPVQTGAFMRVIQLSPNDGKTPPHEVDIAADGAAALEMSPQMIDHYKQLVLETGALFGARHYRDYHFLYTLSDYVSHFGLEHHESSDDRVPERTLLDKRLELSGVGLLPHEFTHSWNGKYRRPADLTTPDYQEPMKDDLLWVYEGLTQYLGEVLTARSSLCAPDDCREQWAYIAATLDHRAGRTWRPLQDTADSGPFLYAAGPDWISWRRTVDFYDESALIWLEVDTIIRQQSHGRRSMDDFCHLFHGGQSGPPAVKTYTFDDVVAALNEIAAYDWRSHLTERLTSLNPRAPLGGIENGGWRLAYDDKPNRYQSSLEHSRTYFDQTFSIGAILGEDGAIHDVIPGMAADKAGIVPGMKLLAINGRQWPADGLRDALVEAIAATKTASGPLVLLVSNAEYSKNYQLDYHDGARYPHLVRESNRPDMLSEILKPHASQAH